MLNKKINYNPDILNALANLSSDEVFTSPELANQILDLLPQELFKNPNTTFLDPASKSGVFLREIAKRLIKGLKNEFPNLQERLNHIFTKQLFGIAITELTALLSKRTLYCSKKANSKYSVCTAFKDKNGNIFFDKIKHVWYNGKCKYCGASQEIYEREDSLETHAYAFIHKTPEEILKLFGNKKMKFDVIIGNPPYQMKSGGFGAQATPIYDKFVIQAKKLNPKYIVMIIPSRWFTTGMGLNNFRKEMLNDKRIKELHDFFNAREVFPGVEIKGGVCYFLWDKEYNGNCKVVSHYEDKVISEMKRPLLEDGVDVFIRYNEAVSILKKVLSKKEESFSKLVKPITTFGFPTNFNNFKDKPFENSIKLYANQKIGYIKKEQILKNKELINKWKVYVPEAIGTGDISKDIIKPILGEPNSVCTATYIINGPYNSKREAENVIKYIKTKFFHFMLGLAKNTQHTTQKVYKFVPMQDFTSKSDIDWSKPIPEIDKQLYKKYGLTKEEIDFIESMIKPME